MEFAVHPAAAEAFNRRALELLEVAKVTPAPVGGSPPQPSVVTGSDSGLVEAKSTCPVRSEDSSPAPEAVTGSAAHVPIAAQIVNPSDLVRRSSDSMTGELLEVAFVAGDKRVVLSGPAADNFTKLAFDVVARRELREACSQKFAERSLTDWMRARVLGTATCSWTETFVQHLAASVKTYSFRVPLVGMVAGSPFAVGPYRVSFITAADVEELVSRSPEHLRGALRERETKLYQGKCCVDGEVTAEPSKAADLALDAAEDVVRALRLVHPAAFDIGTRCELGVMDRVHVPGWHVFLRSGAEKPRVSKGTDYSGDVPFAYSAADHKLLGQLGLDAASRFLTTSEPSALHRKAWSALAIFARGLELGTWRDKLINALVAAETLLLKSETEPIQHSLGLRMAHFVCDSLADRKALISELHFAYRARSAFIHHGRDAFAADDRQRLTSVLVACRQVIHNCLQSNVATPEALIASLDDVLLGGTPPETR